MTIKRAIEIGPRPRSRGALMCAILIIQAALLMGATLLIDYWVRAHAPLDTYIADRLFILTLSVSFGVLALTGVVFFLMARRYKDTLEDANEQLTIEVRRQVTERLESRNALIHGLAKLADYRDTDTGDHLERIGSYARLLAGALRERYPRITDEWTERLVLASSLHDIGKVGIPDDVLLKPGKLTPEERRIMERHTLIGADTLLSTRSDFGHDALIDMGIRIALQHHEKWDGSGYPFGLSGEQIALSARIVALADVYDALTSARVYKDAMTHEQAIEIIDKGRGTHFDPDVVDAFHDCESAFDEVRVLGRDHTLRVFDIQRIREEAQESIDEFMLAA